MRRRRPYGNERAFSFCSCGERRKENASSRWRPSWRPQGDIGAKRSAYDNAVAESCSDLKNELVHHGSLDTHEAARTVLRYIEPFYNRKRLHQDVHTGVITHFDAWAPSALSAEKQAASEFPYCVVSYGR